MKRGLIGALFLAVGACGQASHAQSFQHFSDELILYLRDGETDHGSIVVFDTAAKTSSDQTIVALTLAFEGNVTDWDYHAAIDDRFGEILKDAPSRLAATHTEPAQGRRTYLLVTDAPDRVITALKAIVAPAGVVITAERRPVSELATWRPTRLEAQASGDDSVRNSLAQQGDDGTSARPVDFYFYEGDQQGLRKAAKASGFKTRKTDGKPEGSILTLQTAVDAKTLNSLNSRFLDWSDRFQADYDGWETVVVKK